MPEPPAPVDASRQGNWPSLREFVTERHDTYPAIDPTKVNLAGKSVLITGASKGVGKAMALSFARAGCSQIALAARSPLDSVVAATRAAAKSAGRGTEPHVLALNVDVTSEESVRQAAQTVAAEFGGRVDVVVANAGYLEDWKPITEGSPAEWWKTWEVNVKGVYLTAHFFLPLVLASETRTFVAVSSVGAHGIRPGASAYQTTKFAVCRFVEFLDVEYHGQGLVAVAMHPGAVATELAKNMPKEMHAVLVDQPELPADFTVWLAAQRREWLAGRFVSVGADVVELEGKKDEILEKNLFKFRMLG